MPQQPRQIEQFWKNFTMNCFLEGQSCRCDKRKKSFLCRFCKNTPPKRPLSGRFQRPHRRPIERTHKFTWGNSVRLLPYLLPFGGQRGCPTSSVSFSFQRSTCMHVFPSLHRASVRRSHCEDWWPANFRLSVVYFSITASRVCASFSFWIIGATCSSIKDFIMTCARGDTFNPLVGR